MPRIARTLVPGGLYHVISRFVDRRFELNDLLRVRVIELAERVFSRSDWSLLGYGLMSTHMHWAVLAGESPSSDWTRRLHGSVARAIQKSRARNGTALGCVFGNRPNELLMEPGDTARLLAYIHNNPVRAGVVRSAERSRWTSHRAMIGLDEPRAVNVELAMRLAGFAADATGRAAFHAYVSAQAATCRELAPPCHAAIRAAARATTKRPLELGGPRVEGDRIHYDVLQRAERDPPRDGVSVASLVAGAAARIGVPVDLVRSPTRIRPVIAARRLAVLAARLAGIPMADVSAALNIARTTASDLVASTRPEHPLHAEAVALIRALSSI